MPPNDSVHEVTGRVRARSRTLRAASFRPVKRAHPSCGDFAASRNTAGPAESGAAVVAR